MEAFELIPSGAAAPVSGMNGPAKPCRNTILNDYLYLAHRLDTRKAQRFCQRLAGRVLDIGCGTRPYQRFLPRNSRYLGMDYSTARRPDVAGSVLNLPIRTSSMDAVICNQVIEHVPEPAVALREISRVLRTGGLLYLTAPQAWGLHYEPDDYYRFTKYGIRHMLLQSGFEILTCERIGGLFSYFTVMLFDLFVTRGVFPVLDVCGIRRGRYRLAASLILPAALFALPIVSLLDHIDRTNAYAWAVLAVKI